MAVTKSTQLILEGCSDTTALNLRRECVFGAVRPGQSSLAQDKLRTHWQQGRNVKANAYVYLQPACITVSGMTSNESTFVISQSPLIGQS